LTGSIAGLQNCHGLRQLRETAPLPWAWLDEREKPADFTQGGLQPSRKVVAMKAGTTIKKSLLIHISASTQNIGYDVKDEKITHTHLQDLADKDTGHGPWDNSKLILMMYYNRRRFQNNIRSVRLCQIFMCSLRLRAGFAIKSLKIHI